MKKTVKHLASAMAVAVFLVIAFGSGDDDSTVSENSKVDSKFELSSFQPNKTFEFHEGSIVSECKDPTIRKVTVLDDKTAKIYVWHKGCPNNRIEEEELIYNYRIDESTNWNQEYDWLKTDSKVIFLENNNAGYYNGYMYLAKRYMISNAYNKKTFLDARIFEQLDLQEYPGRRGVYTGSGRLKN